MVNYIVELLNETENVTFPLILMSLMSSEMSWTLFQTNPKVRPLPKSHPGKFEKNWKNH